MVDKEIKGFVVIKNIDIKALISKEVINLEKCNNESTVLVIYKTSSAVDVFISVLIKCSKLVPNLALNISLEII